MLVAERAPGGGTLTRITGPTATQIARFDALPRALAVDQESVFVETPSSVERVSRRTGEVARIATGAAFSQLASDADSLYVTESAVTPARPKDRRRASARRALRRAQPCDGDDHGRRRRLRRGRRGPGRRPDRDADRRTTAPHGVTGSKYEGYDWWFVHKPLEK